MTEGFENIVWFFTNDHDRDGRIVKLRPDGRVVGQENINYHTWEQADGRLVIRHIDGRPSAAFDAPAPLPDSIEGRFVLWPNAGLKARLARVPGVRVLRPDPIERLADGIETIAEAVEVCAPETANEETGPQQYRAARFDLARVRNATVLNQYGVVAKDGAVALETIFHIPFHATERLFNFADIEFGCVETGTPARLPRALSACAGVSENYFHWLLFFVARIAVYAQAPSADTDLVVLLPGFLSEAQERSAALVAAHYGLPIQTVRGEAPVLVEELLVPYQPASIGVDPHPAVMRAFEIIRHGTAGEATPGAERIYVSRSDSPWRRLENEPEIEALLRQFDFQVVRLTGLSLAQQVALFSQARVVIGPHGAGLTNLGFCEPGTKVLEFQSPRHPSPCMKHLAFLAGLEYRSLMGFTTLGDRFRVDPGALLQAMGRMRL